MSNGQLVLIELILVFSVVIWLGLSEIKKMRDLSKSRDLTGQDPKDSSSEQNPDK